MRLDCEQSLFSSKISLGVAVRDCERDVGAAMPRASSSVGVGRRAKRETALVSYNDLKAWYSGDVVILLVGLRRSDAHLSVTFMSDIQRTPKLCCNVCCGRQKEPAILISTLL